MKGIERKMKHEWIKSILKREENEESIKVNAWVRSKRVSKSIAFLVISDGSCQETLQLIIEAGSEAFETLESIHTGAAIAAEGELRESPARGQKWEILVRKLELIGSSSATDYPLQKKNQTLEYLI